MEKRKNAVLYARTTYDEIRNSEYPISYQFDELRRYCNRNNINVLEQFYDVWSGETFERPEYIKMMKYLNRNKSKIDIVLFHSTSRFREKMNAQLSNIEIAKMMCMKIEPRALRDPYFLPGTTDEEMQEHFKRFRAIERAKRKLEKK